MILETVCSFARSPPKAFFAIPLEMTLDDWMVLVQGNSTEVISEAICLNKECDKASVFLQ